MLIVNRLNFYSILYDNIAQFIKKTCQIDARDIKLNKKRILSEIIANFYNKSL